MISLVLLPGMDGTGALFAPFIEALGDRCGVRVVSYPPQQPMGYEQLESFVRSVLPTTQPYVLLGESFSGPIAIRLAAQRPLQLKGLILCCTFARNPRPLLAGFRGLLGPLPSRVPLGMLERVLLGGFCRPELRAALARSLDSVAPQVLKARLRAVLTVDARARLASVQSPVLYLRAAQDKLVPAAASRVIMARAPQASLVELQAPHFLLQTVPDQAAAVVAGFLEQVSAASSASVGK